MNALFVGHTKSVRAGGVSRSKELKLDRAYQPLRDRMEMGILVRQMWSLSLCISNHSWVRPHLSSGPPDQRFSGFSALSLPGELQTGGRPAVHQQRSEGS